MLKAAKQGGVCIWTEPRCAAGVAAGLGDTGMSPWGWAVLRAAPGSWLCTGVFCDPCLLLQPGTWRLFWVTVGKNLESVSI